MAEDKMDLDARLSAYLDGELNEADMAELEALIAGDETVAERVLTAPAGQEEPIHLSDMHRALLTLPPERREALLLVGAGGFSYEEAANICGCAVGTIKSRVGRARSALNTMLADGSIPKRSIDDDTAHRAILEELDDVAAGQGVAARS